MERNFCLSFCLSFFLCFNLCVLIQGIIQCPPRTFKPYCRNCTCEWLHTKDCSVEDGKCQCEDGFQGKRCDEDVNECFTIPGICGREVCINYYGSYKCTPCPIGYQGHPSGNCDPCSGFTYGFDCKNKCKCVQSNTLYCHPSDGECICLPGWESADCGLSINDCKENNCPEGTCEDRHLHYACICGDNYMVIGYECKPYTMDFISLDRRPAIGEWVDIYMFFSLPDLYYSAFHLAPDLTFKISDDQSEGECWVDFKVQSRRIKGNEPILSKIPRSRPYEAYIHFKRRFFKQAKTRVTADSPDLHRKWDLVFDARYKSKTDQMCLEKMTIPGTEMVNITKAKAFSYERQAYLQFEIVFGASKDCFETPRVIWNYYQVDVPINKKLCLAGHSFKQLDIDKIAKKNGELPISDHHQHKEIVIKNTIPLGVSMLCVTAYVQRSISRKAVACGFIEIKPSWAVTGKLWPSSSFITANTRNYVFIVANYKEPDMFSKIRTTWTCREPVEDCESYVKLDIFDTSLSVRPHVLHEGVTYLFEACITIVDRPWKTVQRNFTVHVGSPLTHLKAEIFCKQECNNLVSGLNVMVMESLVSLAKWYNWSLIMEPLDKSEPPVTYKGPELEKYRTPKWSSRYFFTKVNSLPSGHKITLAVIGSRDTPDGIQSGRAEYEFITMKHPIGEGCTISPTWGKAVFTKFTVNCSGYKDVESGLPLVYKLYQEVIDKEQTVQVLVGYSNQGVISSITLSSESPTTNVKLEVKISTVFQISVTCGLTVQLITDDQDDILERTITERKSLSTVGSQEELRLVKDVATIMKASSTADTETKKTVRKQLMKNMKNFEAVAGDTIEHSSTALMELAARDDEVDDRGLGDGLKAAERITKYLGKCGAGNIAIVKDVASLQVSAMNNLVKIASNYGKGIQKVAKTEKKKFVKQGKENSRKTISSMSQIVTTLRGGFDISNEPIKIKKDTMEVVLESKDFAAEKMVKMKSDSDAAGFSISSRGLNYLGNGSVETEFEVYDKSPFTWTSDRVQGDIPVMKVNFVEPFLEKDDGDDSNDSKKKIKRAKWQFSKPADVFLKNRNKKNDSTEHSMLLLVNKYSNQVYLSSCVYLSVTASTEKVTILEVSSESDLIFKVKARYTNSISAFDLLTDYDMIDIPFNTIKDEFTTVIGNRTLKRSSNVVYFPKLTKKQFDVGIPYYNAKISIMKGQRFAKKGDTTTHLTAKELAKKNNLTIDVAALDLHNVTVKVTNQELSCVYFDQKKMDYSYDACELSIFTTKQELHCRCVVAAAFSASYLVMPRLIDPTNIQLFAEIFNNPLTVSMVICLWLTFLALFIWGRRKDKDDEVKRGATVLADNKERDTYVYLMCVVTGNSVLAGTTSNVFIFLKGTWGKSDVHALNDSTRALFTRGAENWFVLTTGNDLGFLKSAVIWTDYSGGHPSWFLQKIHVQNVQTGEAWNLLFNSWLSAVKGHGQIIAEIPASEENVYTQGWYSKISGKGKVDIRNEHLWFGMIFKTAYNKFTRFRRLATALSMLQALMIVNLMFYGIRDIDDSRQFQDLFGYRIHLTSIIIGIQSCLVMSLFGIGLAFTFNRIIPKKDPQGLKSPETIAVEQAFKRQKTAITLSALQEYLGHEADEEVAGRILHSIMESDKNREEEKGGADHTLKDDGLWFTLPSWFIHVYWGFIAVFNVFVAYYIMLYGLSLGYEKSVNWVVSFFAGFTFNVLLVQPLKVIGMVVFLVLVFKQTYSLKDMAPVNNMVDASKIIKQHMQRVKTYAMTRAVDRYHRPPNKIQIGEILERLSIEMSAREMLRDLLVYSVFLTALIIMTFRHSHVNDAFWQTQAVNKMLFQAKMSEDGEETNVLDDISTVEDIWSFIGDDVLPFLIKEADDQLDINSLYFIGTARIRQVRVERDQSGCDNLPLNMMDIYQRERCSFSLYNGRLETRHFNNSWFKPMKPKGDGEEDEGADNEIDEDEEDEQSIHQYNTAEELNTAPIAAPLVTYPGGGYILTLPRHDIVDALSTVDKSLAKTGWVDHFTRCLFVEFTLYNPDSNLFTNVVIGFEFDETGGPFPFKIVTSSRLYHYPGDGYWTTITEIIVMICSAFYTVIVAQNFLKGGLAAFMSVWNWVDIVFLALIYVLAYCIHARDAAMFTVLSVFAQYGNNRFLDFQAVFHKDFILSVVEGFVGALGFLKLIYVMRFNPFSKTFTKSVAIAKEDVFGFTVMTILYMVGLSLAAMIIFGRHMAGYTNLEHSLLSLLFFIMGEAEYPSLVATNKVMGPIFFLVVLVVTQYIILNFFLAMIRDGLDMARSLEFGKKDASIRYMLDTVKLYLGIGSNKMVHAE